MKKIEKIDFYSNEVMSVYNLNDNIRYQLKILDSLDPFTRKHSENVGILSGRICEKLNMDEGFTIYCTICGFLHDIGKVFIPPSILQKKGKLTDEEYETMKTHTLIGYKMCHNDLNLRPYEAGPLYHHEALDGTGYPQGLIGNEIVYEGQIIRVADEFDAISSVRQYKTHIGTLDSLKILIENTRPTKSSKRKGVFSRKVGKNDKEIVRALIKVIIEDVEMEIYRREEYIEYMQKERNRYKLAMKYYSKYEMEKDEETKKYLAGYIEQYLVKNEDPNNVPEYLKDVEYTLEKRKQLLKDLKKEYKGIRRLRV